MKKALTIIVLIIIIAATSSYIYLKYSSLGDSSNYFNTNLRYELARYPTARNVLGLHSAGDARSDYLGPQYKKISIDVIMTDGLYMDDTIMKELSARITEATGKPTSYFFRPEKMPYQPAVSLADLDIQLKKEAYDGGSDTAMLYLFVADQNKDASNSVGYTIDNNGIALFESDISQNYSRNDNLDAFDQYVVSVLLHEFGHQIGLEHNNVPNCIMNPSLELSDVERPANIVTDFCDYEKDLIKKMPI